MDENAVVDYAEVIAMSYKEIKPAILSPSIEILNSA